MIGCCGRDISSSQKRHRRLRKARALSLYDFDVHANVRVAYFWLGRLADETVAVGKN
jgi:hypothetical protein